MFQNFKNPKGKNLDLQAKIHFAQKIFLGDDRFYRGQFLNWVM